MKKLAIIMAAALCLCACETVRSWFQSATELFEEEAVASVAGKKLYRSELESYIPDGLSPEDSTALAGQYITTWATNLLLLDLAENQLSKSEKDVSKELEDYRVSLLKYRYEQLYINEKLDTAISPSEITEYYTAHPEKFSLETPIVKVRYMVVPEKAKSIEKIKKKMSSTEPEEIVSAEETASSVAIKYVDHSEQWMELRALCAEFGTDMGTLTGALKNSFIQLSDGEGNLQIAYVVEMKKAGQTSPEDYCIDRVRDFILSGRKHAMLNSLERELLEEAREHQKFVIYKNE